MQIQKQDLNNAVEKQIINTEQAQQLWTFWLNEQQNIASFRFIHVWYYLGGLLALSAMSLFITLGFMKFGGSAIVSLSILYSVIVFFLAKYFKKHQFHIPAGICATFLVALIPLGIYGLQDAMGMWNNDYSYADYYHWIDQRWIWLEIGTLIGGLVWFYYFRYPFLLMPIALTVWYMSMDYADLMYHKLNEADYVDWWKFRKYVSICFGIILLLISLRVDFAPKRNRYDYAFWLYLFGTIAFWGGLSSLNSDSE